MKLTDSKYCQQMATSSGLHYIKEGHEETHLTNKDACHEAMLVTDFLGAMIMRLSLIT